MQDQLGQLDVLNAQVERFGGSDAAECVIDGRIGLKPSMKDEALATWMKNAIDRMDAAITESTRMEIMEACGKNCSEMNRRVIEAGLARRRKYKTEEAFLDAEVKTPKASVHIERGDGVIYQVYAPRGFGKGLRCFWSLTRGLPDAELMSPTYCICSEAFARNYWREVLGRPVKVKLIESGLTGSDVCRFEICL